MSDSSFSRSRKVGAGGLAFLVGAGTLFAATPAFAAPGDAVTLDPTLQSCINLVLGKPAGDVVTEGELAGLTGSLNCITSTGTKIASLDGLEHAVGLTGLDLANNNITDLTPISGLTNLTSLSVANNSSLTSVAPISSLVNLENLQVTGAEAVTDWNSLSTLTSLTEFKASYTGIDNVSFLSGMTDLSELVLNNNPALTDLSPISGLTDLYWLSIYGTGVTNLDDVGSMTGIEWLDLGGGSIDDFSGILNLANLTELSISDAVSTSWGQLAGLTVNLDDLYISGVNSNIDWIEGLNVETLSVWNAGLQSSDMPVVAGVEGLKFLYLENNEITNISALAGLTSLETIFLNDNGIADLSPLGDIATLVNISASGQSIAANPIKDQNYANPFVDLDGTPIAFSDSQYDVGTNTFLFDSLGTVTTSWSVTAPSTGLPHVFSGDVTFTVVEEDYEEGALTGFGVIRNSADPQHAVNAVFSPKMTAESYEFTFVPTIEGTPVVGGTPVVHTYIPESPGFFPLEGLVLDGLTANQEYSITATWTSTTGVVAPATAPIFHHTDAGGGVVTSPAALNNLAGVSNSDNTIDLTFQSVRDAGGTGGFGDVSLFTAEFRLAGSELAWQELTTVGTNDTEALQITNIPAGTYEVRVKYTTTTGDTSEVSSVVSNIVVKGFTRPDGDGNGPGVDGKTPAKPGDLKNSASNINMGQIGLLAGGGLMLAAAGALMVGSRRSRAGGSEF